MRPGRLLLPQSAPCPNLRHSWIGCRRLSRCVPTCQLADFKAPDSDAVLALPMRQRAGGDVESDRALVGPAVHIARGIRRHGVRPPVGQQIVREGFCAVDFAGHRRRLAAGSLVALNRPVHNLCIKVCINLGIVCD